MRNLLKNCLKKLEIIKAKKALGKNGWHEFNLCCEDALFFINNGKSKDVITFRHERTSFTKAFNKVYLYRQGTCQDGESAVNIVAKIKNFCEEVSTRAEEIKTDFLENETFRTSPVFKAQNADL